MRIAQPEKKFWAFENVAGQITPGNSFREIVYGSPFICVLNILVGLFTHILIYLFIWSLVFSYGEDPYDIQPANSIQTILYCFIVISHLFHTLKFSIWTITTT